MNRTDGGMGRGSTGLNRRIQSSVVKTKEDGGKRTGTLQENRRIREVRSGYSIYDFVEKHLFLFFTIIGHINAEAIFTSSFFLIYHAGLQ